MLSLSHLRNCFTASFIVLFIAACGGGGSGATASPNNGNQPIESLVSTTPVSEEMLGPDVDSDGIRDDVQLYIEDRFSGRTEHIRRIKAVAKLERELTSNLHDLNQVAVIFKLLSKAEICFIKLYPPYSADSTFELDAYREHLHYKRQEIAFRKVQTVYGLDNSLGGSQILKDDFCEIDMDLFP